MLSEVAMSRASFVVNGCLLMSLALSAAKAADEPIFSGPQVGEKITGFKVLGVYGDQEGKELDFVAAAAGKPTLLIFMHDLTRPSAALTRALCSYAQPKAKDGLYCAVVWLAADRSQTEEYLKRAKQSLNLTAPVGISLDGAEGPGSYGLNRKVALTVLVAKDNQVTANFALIQPALTDGPKILAEVARLIDAKPPTLEEVQQLIGGRNAMPADRLRELMRPLINREATEENVKKSAAAVDELVARAPALQRELGQMAQRVVSSGNLKNYGTPAAQEHIRRWAEKYGPKQ
jgi:hypothetical protein